MLYWGTEGVWYQETLPSINGLPASHPGGAAIVVLNA